MACPSALRVVAPRAWGRTVALGILTIAAGLALAPPRLTAAAPARVYVTFVSHNEESRSNPPCAPVLTDRQRYLANRAALVALATQIVSAGATWDVQSEWEYLLRVAEWDDDTVRDSTAGLNVVEYLSRLAPTRLVVDAHSHELRGYNYADVAYLLERLGVAPTGIVGGFIATPASRQTWTRLRQPIRGQRYPAYTWQARALWGGGSMGHRTDSQASGIWRPRSATAFHEDDPAQPLINIGHYTGDVLSADGAMDLVERLRAGALEAGHMYTATIMIPQCTLDVDPDASATVAAIVDRLREPVARGELVWATLPEMARVWRDEYGAVPTIVLP